jgi:hypothetical protein
LKIVFGKALPVSTKCIPKSYLNIPSCPQLIRNATISITHVHFVEQVYVIILLLQYERKIKIRAKLRRN